MDYHSRDKVTENLNAVVQKLSKPDFLKNISASRLPSSACSEASESPKEAAHGARDFASPLAQSPLLNATTAYDDPPEHVENISEVVAKSGSGDHGRMRLSAAQQTQLCPPPNHVFVHAWKSFSRMAADRGFQTFSHGHQDLVLAVDFNFFGTRMVTASSDHRLAIWDKKDDTWAPVDRWRAHDAEIVDAKWSGPFVGEIIGSIAEDGRFRVWQEDVTEVANSGRRFKLISTIQSDTKVPFMSLDFKCIMQETWAAVITRDGQLTIYEPIEQGKLSDWQILAQKHVCSTPDRSEETSFRVCFHHDHFPEWKAVLAGLDRKALSLAVAAMDVVKIYRTDKQRRFYVAAELTGSRNIIRDVAWANGSMRGYDVIATASKDGAIRIYEVSTPTPTQGHGQGVNASEPSATTDLTSSPRPRGGKNAPSGISSGLAGASKTGENLADGDSNPGRITHNVRKAAELTGHHEAVWRLSFSQMGDLLVSTGDDGAVRTWKRAVNNTWLEYAEVEISKER